MRARCKTDKIYRLLTELDSNNENTKHNHKLRILNSAHLLDARQKYISKQMHKSQHERSNYTANKPHDQ
jgi:hypothetical protein